MSDFTTRPEISGYFGVVTSTHWIASAVGMAILEKGGNAFDAAVATGFVLQVVEPHLNGAGGDMPAIIYSRKKDKVEVICAQGQAPAKASIEHYKNEGLKLIPGDGLLATVIPGAFDGWMLMLRDYGTMHVRDILEPAIYYLENGHPVLPRVSDTIAGLADFFKQYWPSSYDTWLPHGNVPQAGSAFKNIPLANTWKKIIAEAEAKSAKGREAEIDAARDAFYRGFVAEEIAKFLKTANVMDASGQCHKAVLTSDDLANYQATIEAPQTYDYHGWTIAKTQPWGQGPVFLQSLALLKNFDLSQLNPCGDEFVHLVVEAMKLAYADREVYYGDPEFQNVPIDILLSDTYNKARSQLISDSASLELRAGKIAGFEQQYDATISMLDSMSSNSAVYEPTMSHLTEKKGDTVHLDIIDREGNMVAVTPSGGWLQSSPIIPSLGFCLNSRAQMFWLKAGLPSSLMPGKRPRTTLTPSLALYEGRPRLAFGTPGGDQQDQWQLSFFLRHVHYGLNLQASIDQPLFHSTHFPGSFFPRTRLAGGLMLEKSFGEPVIEALKKRGHILTVADAWSIGRLTAASRDENGLLKAAATPRLMQAYAIGR